MCVGEDGIRPWMDIETSLAPFSFYRNCSSYQFPALVTGQEEYWPLLDLFDGKENSARSKLRKVKLRWFTALDSLCSQYLKTSLFLVLFLLFSLPPFLFFSFFSFVLLGI